LRIYFSITPKKVNLNKFRSPNKFVQRTTPYFLNAGETINRSDHDQLLKKIRTTGGHKKPLINKIDAICFAQAANKVWKGSQQKKIGDKVTSEILGNSECLKLPYSRLIKVNDRKKYERPVKAK